MTDETNEAVEAVDPEEVTAEKMDQRLNERSIVLGQIFAEILKFPKAVAFMQANFDIEIDDNDQVIRVTEVPESEIAKRVAEIMAESTSRIIT